MTMQFSPTLISRAVRATNGELAWNRVDVPSAIDELVHSEHVILGGEAWAVVSGDTDIAPLMRIDDGRVALGLIPGKNGSDYVFQWSCNAIETETWNDYVQRSKKEALDMIQKMDVENAVSPKLSQSIYYNLTFTSFRDNNRTN